MHTILVSELPGGADHAYQVVGLPNTKGVDGFRKMCRQMSAVGMTGGAQVVTLGAQGAVRFRVKDIVRAGSKSLQESDKGFRLVRYEPYAVERLKAA